MNTLDLIKEKKEDYREYKKTLKHEKLTAQKLGFSTEVNKIENDIKWVDELFNLLEEIAIRVQNNNK